MTLTKRHGIIAFIIALLLHLSLALAWILNREPSADNAIQPGLAGVSVSLVAAGDLMDAAESEAASAATTAEFEEPLETLDPQADTPVEPEPEPEPVPQPRPQPAPAPQPTPVAAERVAELASEQSGESDSETDEDASQASTVGASTQGSDEVTDTGGDPAAEANYFVQLSHYLGQHKRYPMAARRQRREGVAEVEFTLSRSGEVLRARVINSSGHGILDREVIKMLERAAPMPAFPSSFSANQLVITLPVSFNLSDRR